MIQKTAPDASATKPKKRSILGMLFNPQLGPAISPLRDSTNVFVHLLAAVFAMYGLFPKDHPALRDQTISLSLFQVLGAAWKRVEFTRDGMPRTIIFFAVVGMMTVSTFVIISALLSMFVGHAHAAAFDAFAAPPNTDIAQSWMTYLFSANGTFPTEAAIVGGTTGGLANPFPTGLNLQAAFIACLGAYSDAILVVAAFILFYHLAAMVVETAHHGQVMGKRASQIWAPIRLVFAIGLLVPINSGLNCGQLIVIKIAGLGSTLATNLWTNQFLPSLMGYNPTLAPPGSPVVSNIALSIIRMQACALAWNNRVDQQMSSISNGAATYTFTTNPNVSWAASMKVPPQGIPYTENGITGMKYAFTSASLADADICGWYFIPGAGQGAATSLGAAATQQQSAITSSMSDFQTAANGMANLMNGASANTVSLADMNKAVQTAVVGYQNAVQTNIGALANGNANLSTALTTMGNYGWVMAGATLNTIDRMEADISSAASDSTPKTTPPILGSINLSDKPHSSVWDWLWGKSTDDTLWNIRKNVADDMTVFDIYTQKSITAPAAVGANNNAAQCAAMVGLQTPGSGFSGGMAEYALGIIESMAEWAGVWSTNSGAVCGTGAGAGSQTFSVGFQITGLDPFTQMISLGHKNLSLAIELSEISMAASAASAAATSISKIPVVGTIASGAAGLAGGAAGFISFFALLFWVCGFTLAYLVPLMPFMRFFFAVLSWMAAIIEAVVAVPLIALAHLNPEGEGLGGQQAQQAYGFLFSLFLRPVMTVFGFMCGMLVFLVALSFLNFGYAVAVAGAGGTAYGHAALSHIIYSIFYVGIVYICANHSFQLIDHLPDHAMGWFGKQGQAAPNMGKVDSFEKVASAVDVLGARNAMKGMNAGAAQLGQGAGKMGEGIVGLLNRKKPPKGNGDNPNNPMLSAGGNPSGGSGGNGRGEVGVQSNTRLAGSDDGGNNGGNGSPPSGSGGPGGIGNFATSGNMMPGYGSSAVSAGYGANSGGIGGGQIGGYSTVAQNTPQSGTQPAQPGNYPSGHPATPQGDNVGQQIAKTADTANTALGRADAALAAADAAKNKG